MFDGLGTMGEWASALASVVGILISLKAMSQSEKANKQALESTEQANAARERAEVAVREADAERSKQQLAVQTQLKELNEKSLELDRERKDSEERTNNRFMAGSVSAWWVQAQGNVWGVVVSNAGRFAGMLRDVKIIVDAKNQDKFPIAIKVLPPGTYFVESENNTKTWKFARDVSPKTEYSSILNSEDFVVQSIEFTDVLGSRWRWTRNGGLTLLG